METAEHASDLGRWQTVHRPASPHLRAYVHGYVGTSSTLHIPIRERHLPSLEVPLVVNFGAPHRRLAGVRSEEWTAHDGVWVVGLHRRHQTTTAVGERRFMIVRFTPIGAHLFLGLPMHLLANEAVDLGLIDPVLARMTVNRLATEGGWTERFSAMEALIAARLAGTAIPTSVAVGWHTLVAADGRVPLGSLASDLGCSHRTMIARFQTFVGFPPKTVARLLRFNRVMRLLDRLSRARADESVSKPYIEHPSADRRLVGAIRWADLAAECGYVDQAHLIKDFQEFAGLTPRAFLHQVSYQI
jgi:AraC-like DNA-binding protein